MSQNNKKQNRSFVPQSVGDALKKINRQFTSKFGKIEFIINSKWSDIAGKYFAEYSEPKNVQRLLDYKNEMGEPVYKNYLNVSVAPAAALEFQHFKDNILEKINSYFGYKAIIDLRIQQNYITKHNMNKPNTANIAMTEDDVALITKEVQNITNKDLKETLTTLGKNIAKESKY